MLAILVAPLALSVGLPKAGRTSYPTKYPTKFPTSFVAIPGQCPPQGKTCSARGDPHYRSFDGARFDWQGMCEYVFMRDAREKGTQFEVQVRHTDRRMNRRKTHQVTAVLAVAMKLPNGDLVELHRDPTCKNNFPPLFPPFTAGNTINGQPMPPLPYVDKEGNHFEYGPVPKQLTRRRNGGGYKGKTIMITVPSVGVHVVWTGCNWIEAHLDSTSPLCGNTAGLCGNADNRKGNDDKHAKLNNWWQAGHNYPDVHGFKHADGISHIFAAPKNGGGLCKKDEIALPPATPDDGCTPGDNDWIAADAVCNVLKTPSGEYAKCHSTIDAESYYKECMVDACMISPGEAASTINEYEEDCCEKNVIVGDGCVPWQPQPPPGGWPVVPDTKPPTTASPTTSAPTEAATLEVPPGTMAGVSGDPFVVDQKGMRVQFFLPLNEEMHLLTCQGLKLYGRTMGSGIEGDHQQWFDLLRINFNGKERLMVGIQENSTQIEAQDVDVTQHRKDLAVLSVVADGEKVKRTGAVVADASIIAAWQDETGETVQFSEGRTMLQIKSAVAQKFIGAEQARYTHLDLRFVELKSSECTAGVLAEIWGTAPMTQATVEMLKPPQ